MCWFVTGGAKRRKLSIQQKGWPILSQDIGLQIVNECTSPINICRTPLSLLEYCAPFSGSAYVTSTALTNVTLQCVQMAHILSDKTVTQRKRINISLGQGNEWTAVHPVWMQIASVCLFDEYWKECVHQINSSMPLARASNKDPTSRMAATIGCGIWLSLQ